MVARIRNLTVDCQDAFAQAQFWSGATGWPVDPDSVAGDAEVLVAAEHPQPADADASGMLFVVVPEGKTAKNRMHVDLCPTDHGRDEEVARLLSLGASIQADHRTSEGPGWVVMADPEGNEFCVERSAAERAGG